MQQAFTLQATGGVASDKNGPRLDAIFTSAKPALSVGKGAATTTPIAVESSTAEKEKEVAPAAATETATEQAAVLRTAEAAPTAAPATEPAAAEVGAEAEVVKMTAPTSSSPPDPPSLGDGVEHPEWLVHLGYCDHTANTDNAWIESAVGHFHCPSVVAGADLLLGEGTGIKDVRWIKVPPRTAAGTFCSRAFLFACIFFRVHFFSFP